MKKTILCPLALLFTCLLLAPSGHAQTLVTQEGDITAGVGLSYGTDISEIGLSIQGFYAITDEIRAGAGYTHFFTGDDNWGASEFNLDGHYLFKNEDGLVLYGLAGLNFARTSVSFGGFSDSHSETGVNLGGGVEYDLGSLFIFGEPKFTLGGFEQLTLTGGVRLRF